jgi:hypothetical protein
VIGDVDLDLVLVAHSGVFDHVRTCLPQAVGVDGPVGGDSVKTGAGVFEVFAILRR